MMLTENQLDAIAKNLGYLSMQEAITKLYVQQKQSLEACAERLDLSIYLVRKLIQQYHLSAPQTATRNLSLSLTDLKKHTLGQLALKHGVSRSTIWRLKKKATNGEAKA